MAGPLQIPPFTAPAKEPYDPEPQREKIRGRLAVCLIGLFALEVIALFASVIFGWLTIAEAKEMVAILVTPTVGLAGAVTGFYYGGKSGQ